MKSLESWFEDYSVSHQNETNKMIHYVFVPLIFFSVVGLFMSIPSGFLSALNNVSPVLSNWGFVMIVLALFFYFSLSFKLGMQMLVFAGLCLITNYYISQHISIFFFSILVFVVGWIAQFYGHKVEGMKPSFFKDLQFLLIGPAWVIDAVFKK